LKSAKLLTNGLGIEDLFPLIDQSRISRTNTQFNYESHDIPIIDSKQRFKVNFFNAILDRAYNPLTKDFYNFMSMETYFHSFMTFPK